MNLKQRVMCNQSHANTLSAPALDEWEGTAAGVCAMHDRIEYFGQDEVDTEKAPKDWAYELVGILGCGYSAVTREAVLEALQEERWTQTSVGALPSWGGAMLPSFDPNK